MAPENVETKPTVRAMTSRDIGSVLSLMTTTDQTVLDQKEFEKQRRKKNTTIYVATLCAETIGYVVAETHKDFFQITSLGIHPDHVRKRVGTHLIRHLVDQLPPTKRRKVVVDVRESNLAAQLFLQSCRFRCVEIVKKLYEIEDGYRFEYRNVWPEKMTMSNGKGVKLRVR